MLDLEILSKAPRNHAREEIGRLLSSNAARKNRDARRNFFFATAVLDYLKRIIQVECVGRRRARYVARIGNKGFIGKGEEGVRMTRSLMGGFDNA